MHHAVRPRRRIVRVAPLLLATGVLLGSCGTGTTPDATQAGISPETFISTYIDLRLAVVGANPGFMNDSIRSAILARHGVTAQELEDFAKMHGANVPYMRAIWEKVETRMQDTRPNAPSSAVPAPPSDAGRHAPDGPAGRTPKRPAAQMVPDGPPGSASARQAGGQRNPDGQRVPPAH